MSVRIRIIETVPTKAHRRIPALARLRRRMIKLQNLREQGTPDRIGEEDLLCEMERSKSVTKKFWEQGGYQWAG
jgi:hypothetical protein